MSRFGDLRRPVFGAAPAHGTRAKAVKLARRRVVMLAEASAVLAHLPGPGESLHAIMTGRYGLAHLLTALLGRLGACERMRVATLAFSEGNVGELCLALDSGAILALSLLCSDFFKDHSQRQYARAAEELGKRGQKLASGRNHCKVVTMQFAGGARYALEGSANLRSNSNREQFCLVHDAGLHDFHAEWIDEMVADGEEGERGAD